MARVVQSAVNVGVGDWYVPDIEDNRSDPTPFRVRIAPASAADIKKIEGDLIGRMTGRDSFYERAYRAQLSVISKCVGEVEGYAVADQKTGEVREPKTGAELVEAIMAGPESETAVLDDLIGAIKSNSKLADGMEKKLRSQRGSCSPAIAPGNGAARSAEAIPLGMPSAQRAGANGRANPSDSNSIPNS